MSRFRPAAHWALTLLALALCLVAAPAYVRGQEAAPAQPSVAVAATPAPVDESAVKIDHTKTADGKKYAALDTGDTAWVLISAALVLMMTAPGLALFYSGLVRRKNVLSVLMQCFILMGVVSVVWALVGYSLAFAEGNAFVGGLPVRDAPRGRDRPGRVRGQHPAHDLDDLPVMFAIITPALICGAYAERMKFAAMLVFSVLWLLVIYCPLAHMVWGKGGLFNAFLPAAGGPNIPALDFAGGTVVHISSGVSALVCALVLGKRLGYGPDADAAAQRRPERGRGRAAVGRVVRVQRRQRAGGQRAGVAGVRQHALRRRRRDARVGADRVAADRQADRARGDLRGGRRAGRDHPGRRVHHPDVRDRHGPGRRGRLLLRGDRPEARVRVRRLARRVRRPRRRRHARGRPDRRVRRRAGSTASPA
jgi:hypothetical protein